MRREQVTFQAVGSEIPSLGGMSERKLTVTCYAEITQYDSEDGRLVLRMRRSGRWIPFGALSWRNYQFAISGFEQERGGRFITVSAQREGLDS